MNRFVKHSTKTFAKGRMKSCEMNKTEKEYANHLEHKRTAGEILWWSFEGVKFKLADKCHYNPDFAVMLPDGTMEIHEVKGSLSFIQDDAKVKIKVAAERFPFKFVLVAPVAKKHGGGWETKVVE